VRIKEYTFGFNGQEKDNEVYGEGNSYTAEYWQYDPRIGRRWNLDPVVKPHRSPYDAFSNNPIINVDPDGADDGIFIDSDGNKIGDDGIDDGKVYAEKTTDKNFVNNVPGAGIAKKNLNASKDFIKANTGNKDAFVGSDIYSNFVEIESDGALKNSIIEIIKRDDGTKGTSRFNNMEHGGVVGMDNKISEGTSQVGDPSVSKYLEVEYPQVPDPKFRFHSHASGTKTTFSRPLIDAFAHGGMSPDAGVLNSWIQSPSPTDISNSGGMTNYVFARGTGKVYVYNASGVQAVISLKAFLTTGK
jgi:RHS repeat-associated protein